MAKKLSPKPTPPNTLEALLAELSSHGTEVDGFVTCRQLRKKSGISQGRISEFLTALYEEGRLEVRRIKQPSIVGDMRPVPAYRLKQK